MSVKVSPAKFSKLETRFQEQERQVGELLKRLRKIEEYQDHSVNTLKEVDNNVHHLLKCDSRQAKRLKNLVVKRTREMLVYYENGAKKTIFGNLQGSLFKKYDVKAYEEMSREHLGESREFIEKWEPNRKLEKKIAKWKIDYEQLTLLDDFKEE